LLGEGDLIAVLPNNPEPFVSDESDLNLDDADQQAGATEPVAGQQAGADTPAAGSSASSAAAPEVAPKPDEHERRRQRRARHSVPGSTIRLLTVREASAELGVSTIWWWQHRHDPDVPRPLRLGDPSNPKSPVRYRETELLAYIERLQAATNEQRIGNQVPSAAK
jgi:predicted DNA-binding transcriptional regulator AlpA